MEEQTWAPGKRRFDAEAFYSALDAERRSRRQTWKRVAEEAEVSASTLTRMAQGRRPDVDSMAALVAWSGLSADTFVKDAEAKPLPGSLSVISTSLKNDPHLTPEAADALDELMKATYERMRKKG
ncbi:MAG: helix-turn-helix transcriptional regulator [Caldilineaceae bacterium SB0668_bin_21]|nr:helix-turn-helix transcriptional regulator [Caldilineaceae bacterium SB0668_bin_21]